jgi:hydrogenase 3 maturation protease
LLTDEVKKALRISGPGLVVCVGNPLRGDDGAGPFVAESYRQAVSECGRGQSPAPADAHNRAVRVINAETTPENHIEEIIAMNPPGVVFVDAADFGGQPGEARVIPREAISDHALSTHGFPLGALCELILQSIRTEIRFIGIQVKSCALGEGMCKEVKEAAEEIVAELLNQGI